MLAKYIAFMPLIRSFCVIHQYIVSFIRQISINEKSEYNKDINKQETVFKGKQRNRHYKETELNQ